MSSAESEFKTSLRLSQVTSTPGRSGIDLVRFAAGHASHVAKVVRVGP